MLPKELESRLRIPAIAAPMFLVSGPDLVVEACRSGVIGTFPSLNQRSTEGFAQWIEEIASRLSAEADAAPFGVNLIVHKSNTRLTADLDVVVRQRVPLVITSLGAVPDVVSAIHAYGGLVLHDVISRRHAEKAVEAGVDGIIAIAAGAGGHAGALSPFALVAEIRQIFSGIVALGGAISHGREIAAARMMDADLAYLGTRFIATTESLAPEPHKQMVLAARASDIAYTPKVSGIPANFLRPSLSAHGINPDLPSEAGLVLGEEVKAWRDVWSAGQGAGSITDIPTTGELVARLAGEYQDAMRGAALDPFILRS